jgi:hypothetical protein
MKRAIIVALGVGTVVTSAAALSIGNNAIPAQHPSAPDELSRARIQGAAREAHREVIEARYREARARCDALGGLQRDHCFIKAHAVRGRALLEAHAPYTRN